MSLLTDEIRALIGSEVSYVAPDPLAASDFRYFAIAIGDTNPRWRTGEAPPTFICESNAYLDGHQAFVQGGHQWPLPLKGCRVLRAGNEYEFHRPVHAGERIQVTWKLVDIRERMSRDGRPLLIVTSLAAYETVEGERLASNRETLIYQAL